MKRSEYLDDMAVEGDEESESDYEFRNEREYAIKLESEQRPRISYIEQMDAKKIAEKYDRMVVDEVESSFPDDLKHINR